MTCEHCTDEKVAASPYGYWCAACGRSVRPHMASLLCGCVDCTSYINDLMMQSIASMMEMDRKWQVDEQQRRAALTSIERATEDAERVLSRRDAKPKDQPS